MYMEQYTPPVNKTGKTGYDFLEIQSGGWLRGEDWHNWVNFDTFKLSCQNIPLNIAQFENILPIQTLSWKEEQDGLNNIQKSSSSLPIQTNSASTSPE